MNERGSIYRVAIAAAAMLSMTGCDGGPVCGEGTVERDGACVPMSMLVCGEGTVEDDMGNCVPEANVTCGAGTTRNPDTGECEPDLEGCAPGTVAMGAQCVPDGSVICVGPTTFDPATGTCVLTDEACGEGSVLLDGECVPADAALMPEVFAAAEPDDPNFGGARGSFLPPALGEERTLGGCITPDDFDDDDVLDPDSDWFAFSVADPGLYRIRADGLGGASAAFAVFADSGALADQGWFRMAIDLTSDGSERQIYLPAAGNYTLIVFDSRSIGLESLARGSFGFAHVVGGEDTCYFVTVEALPVPAPDALGGGETTGTVGPEPAFYAITATDRTIYQSRLTDDDAVTFMGQSFTVDGTVAVGQGQLVSPAVDAGGTALLVVDHIVSLTLDPVTWTLTLDEIAEVPADGAVTVTHDPADDPGLYYAFEAQAGDVVRIAFTSAEPVFVSAWGPDLSNGIPVCFDLIAGAFTASTECELWYVARQSGSQLVRVFAESATAGTMYTVDFDIDVQTPPTLTLGTPTAVPFAGERTYVRADLSSSVWARFAASTFTGSGFNDVDVRYFDDDTVQIMSLETTGLPSFPGVPLDTQNGVFSFFDRIYGPEFGPVALIEISDPNGFDGDEEVTLELGEVPYTDVTVDAASPASFSAVSVPSDGPAYYFVRGVPGGELTFEVTGTGGADPYIDELNERGLPIDTTDDTFADGTETVTRLMPFRGWLAFAVHVPGGGTVDVSVTQGQPPYDASVGSTPYASICPSEGGAGVALTMSDTDDGLSAPYPFTTFTSGVFFERAVGGVIVSTNGWMTFDNGYGGGSQPGNPSLADPLAPNDVVAPLWTDLDDVEVCVEEDGARFVVEWSGREFGGSRTAQMQVVMLGDGTLEFVYGPAHRLLDEFATVGLENADGTVGIDPGIGVRRNTSILFTPR